MTYIYSFIALIVAILFSVVWSTIGFFGAILLGFMALIDGGTSRRKQSYSTENQEYDHHVHVPIQTVPPEYYSAYSLYLKSPEWRALRKLVLKRDSYKCVDCGIQDGRLSVHHLHYDGIETMTFTVDQLVSVCNRCHDRRHGRI